MSGHCMGSVFAWALHLGMQIIADTDHDTVKWIWNLTKLIGKPRHWRLGLLEFKFDVLHCTGTKHQAGDMLLRLGTADEGEKPIGDDLLGLCINPSTPEEREARCMYMTDYVGKSDHRSVRLPELYLLATITKWNDEKALIMPQEFINEQAKDSYCHQTSSTVVVPELTYN